MKVVDFNNTTHEFFLIHRFDITDFEDNTILLTNESTKESTTIGFSLFELTDGKCRVAFNFTFLENDRFSFKVLDKFDNIIYRGKIIATGQNPQNYKQTNNEYYEY